MKYERKSSSKVLFAAKIALLAVALVWLGHTAYEAQAETCYSVYSNLCKPAEGSCPSVGDCDNDWYSQTFTVTYGQVTPTGYFDLEACTACLCAMWSQCVLLDTGYCGPDPDTQYPEWWPYITGKGSGCGQT